VFNGKSIDKSFTINLSPTVKTLNRLKNNIVKILNANAVFDRIKIYNYKGLEIDDADIEYLKDDQILYLSLDGSSFSVNNYVNEYKFTKWIKSGGYGKVYQGKPIIIIFLLTFSPACNFRRNCRYKANRCLELM